MRIAILEDDPAQAAYLVRALEEQLTRGDTEVSCTVFSDGLQAQKALRNESFDLMLLDWNVPSLEGTELLHWLRVWQSSLVPVLMLSSRGSEHDVANALNLGADDYIVKPFRPLELGARIQRLLARQQPKATAKQERFGRFEFDRVTQVVLIHPDPPSDDGSPPEQYELSDREFKLAMALFQNTGRVMSRAHLLESAGYPADELPSRTLDSHIYRLRNKLGLGPARGLSLRTVYGRGYCLEIASES